ncbi:MarR family winged helix-turn-helix transcriptional regulator [Acetobacterium tundrae]|uniref:MarR family transcriptional regulator n=1 Tax=Acetobacterium tundrae TaxID=132932 RepID=A0ABR6WI62_9FIRM|nr:MarR family transcriptional regulator [Acetobacterium tundrae]MBC3796132.1 MarR family transcriptional regulator [Acetobacterium tundrae]
MDKEFKGKFESIIFEYIDKIKFLLSPETWGNDLFNCSKNELFMMLLLYRRSDVNMTQIADYIGVPLNTATGIVARMEKRGLVSRERSVEDKRVVTIHMTDDGLGKIKRIISEMSRYGQLAMDSFTQEEIQLVFKLIDKVMDTLRRDRVKSINHKNPETKVRKITIE